MLTQLKITVRQKKVKANFDFEASNSYSYFFILDCSTVFNNSENDNIFIERATRPRSTPQPLATKAMSTSLRTQLTINRNKLLSEGKTYFDENVTSHMTLV